jgi:Ca2+-transporting ATPase
MEDGKKTAFMKGAPEVVLDKCSHILSDGEIRELGEKAKSEILKANEEMAQAALRVLGFAYRECSDAIQCTEDHLEHSGVCRSRRDDGPAEGRPLRLSVYANM